MTPKPLDAAAVRKRIQIFYFAAGLNLFMVLYVLGAGIGQTASGTLLLVAGIFIVFAGVNFYMARMLRRRWDAYARQQQATGGDTPS